MDIDPGTADIINKNPTYFEKAVLSVCLQDQAFFTLANRVLCKNTQNGQFIDDFQDVLANAVYMVLSKYMSCFAAPGAAFKPMDATTARVLLNTLIDEQLLLPNEIDPAVELFVECMQISPGQVEIFVKNGFTYWLQKRRLQWMYARQVQSDDWNPTQVFTEIQRHIDSLSVSSDGRKGLYAFGEGLDEIQTDVERYNTGLANLNNALGGGLGRKEFTLFIAGTGAGKTVKACQLGGHFAMQGKKGIIITTEEPHHNLERRIVSNFCNIPFDMIKDGFKPARLSPQQTQAYVELRGAMRNLFIRDWLEDRSKSIITDLELEMREFKANYGRLDFIILDWIGGALGATNLAKPDMIRHVWQATADKMSDLALEHDIPTIAFAQAHPTLALNKLRIDSTTLSECKSLGRNATNIIGITALMDMAETNEERAIYENRQVFWISKSRKSQGGRVNFHRDFAYQRMALPRD